MLFRTSVQDECRIYTSDEYVWYTNIIPRLRRMRDTKRHAGQYIRAHIHSEACYYASNCYRHIYTHVHEHTWRPTRLGSVQFNVHACARWTMYEQCWYSYIWLYQSITISDYTCKHVCVRRMKLYDANTNNSTGHWREQIVPEAGEGRGFREEYILLHILCTLLYIQYIIYITYNNQYCTHEEHVLVRVIWHFGRPITV